MHHLEAACQGGIFFDIFLVLGPRGCPDGAQCTARKSWLQKVGRITGACRTSCTNQRVCFVNEHHDWCGRGLNLVNDLTQTVLEFAFHRGTSLQ